MANLLEKVAASQVNKATMGSGIFFFRHGKTAFNAGSGGASPDRIRGWIDVPLDAAGLKEADELAAKAKGMRLEKIYSSDLQRAMQTATAIGKATGLQPIPTMALRPWNLGDFQGKETATVHKHIVKFFYQADVPVPGGETFNSFANRFIAFMQSVMQEYLKKSTNIGVVSHYRDFKLLQAWIAGKMMGIDKKVFFDDNISTSDLMRVAPTDKGAWEYKVLE